MKLTDNRDVTSAIVGGAKGGALRKQDLLQAPKNELEQLRGMILEKKFAQVAARMRHSPETGACVASLLKEDKDPLVRSWSALVLADAAKSGVNLQQHKDALASAIGDYAGSACNTLHAIKEAVLKDGIDPEFAFSLLSRALSSSDAQVSLSSALNIGFIAEKAGVPDGLVQKLFSVYSKTNYMKSIYGKALCVVAKRELSKALPDVEKAVGLMRGDSIEMDAIYVNAALELAHGTDKKLAAGAKSALETLRNTLAEGTLVAGYPSPFLATVQDALSKL